VKRAQKLGIASILAVLLLGMGGGLLVNQAISSARTTSGPPNPELLTGMDSGSLAPEPAPLALRYAHAVQQGNTDEVIAMTLWMRERLRRVQMETDDHERLDAAVNALEEHILRRTLEGNYLRAGGIEDQYVFAPGAHIEIAGHDAGAEDLEQAVARRTWLRVTYPHRRTAPLDESGRSIHSLEAGVNVSREGHVLKGGVIGNLDIDPDSVRYDWPDSAED
jgi:hypothetical protein